MLFKLLFISLLSVGFASSSYENEFKSYVEKYNKHYNQSEYAKRYKIFSENMDYINYSNMNTSKTYKLGINNFTDMSKSEFNRKYLNLRINQTHHHHHHNNYFHKHHHS